MLQGLKRPREQDPSMPQIMTLIRKLPEDMSHEVWMCCGRVVSLLRTCCGPCGRCGVMALICKLPEDMVGVLWGCRM